MCASICPTVRTLVVGLYEYLLAGMSSAALVTHPLTSPNPARTAAAEKSPVAPRGAAVACPDLMMRNVPLPPSRLARPVAVPSTT
jgi:hypothetical protein